MVDEGKLAVSDRMEEVQDKFAVVEIDLLLVQVVAGADGVEVDELRFAELMG